MKRTSPLLLILLGLLTSNGCQSGPGLSSLGLFQRTKQTSFVTPRQRIAQIRATAKQADGTDSAEQKKIVTQLVMPLATENDPLIRQATLESIAQFNTPLTNQALIAGLDDSSIYVRQTACRLLGKRQASEATSALAKLAHADDEFDVRVAAAKALGDIGADKKSLLAVLEDPNPAMQLVGIEAMRRATGQDLGRDVAAYVALARGENPPVSGNRPATAVANRRFDWLPFF